MRRFVLNHYRRVPLLLVVVGLGPVGQLAERTGRHFGHRVLSVNPVPERRAMPKRHGVETLDFGDGNADKVLERTDGCGPDSIIDAVRTGAHGNPGAALAQKTPLILRRPVGRKLADRMAATSVALDAVQRGGAVSVSGVYARAAHPMPLMHMFDKGIASRTGQCDVHRWLYDILLLLEYDSDPLGVDDLVTLHADLERAPETYDLFKNKQDGCIKVVLHPSVE